MRGCHTDEVEQPRCRVCRGRIGWTTGMVACLPDDPTADGICVPLCRLCGRELLPDDRVADRGRGCLRNGCGCVAEREHEPDYGFTDAEIAPFNELLIAKGCDSQLADAIAGYLLNSLASCGTRVVLALREGDIVVTAEEGSSVVGRDLRRTAAGGNPTQ